MKNNEITIVGAGPLGMLAAKSLSNRGCNVSIIEMQDKNTLKSPIQDGKAIALNQNTVQLLKELDIWSLIPKDNIYPITAAKVINSTQRKHINFQPKNNYPIGYFVKNHIIKTAIFQSIESNSSIELIKDKVLSIEENNNQYSIINTTNQAFKQKLLIAADGRFSKIRDMGNIGYNQHDFERDMLLIEVKHSNNNDNIAIEQFLDNNTTCAILPLDNYSASIALTVGREKTKKLKNDIETLKKFISPLLSEYLGNIDNILSVTSYPMISVYSNKFHSKSLLLVGDAAVGMHPVTAHGFNLGCYSVGLINKSFSKENINSTIRKKLLLDKYELEFNINAKPLYNATNLIVNTFTNDKKKYLRRFIINSAETLPIWKNIIYKRMGISYN